MSLEVKTNFEHMDHRFNRGNLRHARYLSASAAQQAMEKWVPVRSGNLRGRSFTSADGSHIRYTQPYAKAQFYGLINGHPVRNYNDPEGTHPSKRWDLRLKGHKDEMRAVKEEFVKGLKY